MSLAKLTARPIPEKEVSKIVSDLVDAFSTIPGLESIILFGSASRGTMTEASDIDLVLIFDTETNARKGYKEAQHRRKEPLWPLDLLCIDSKIYKERSAVGGVLFIARTEGKTVFERNK